MKRSLVCVLSILALALSAPVMAQSEQSASGTIVSSSADQLVIKTSDGRQMTFMMDNNTNRPSSLSQGSSVTVRYHDMSGTFHAANVAAASGNSNTNVGTSAGNTNTTTATTGTASPTGTTGVTGSTAGTTATGTSATSANAQDRGTTADPTGNDARNTRTTAQDVTGTAGTRDTGTATGTSADQADQDSGTTRLPATASPLPLLGLSGLLALGGGLGVRIVRRRK